MEEDRLLPSYENHSLIELKFMEEWIEMDLKSSRQFACENQKSDADENENYKDYLNEGRLEERIYTQRLSDGSYDFRNKKIILSKESK